MYLKSILLIAANLARLGVFQLYAPATGTAAVLPQRAPVALLAVGGGHPPDGRTHLGVLRPILLALALI